MTNKFLTGIAAAFLFVGGNQVFADAQAGKASGVEFSYEIFDFYNTSVTLNDPYLQLTATHEETGQIFEPDYRTGKFVLPAPGRYRFDGQSYFCFVRNETIEITAQTTSIDLYVGCE
ncbi:MAG TPA: hypothetical protein VE954_24045 [Oligoflexus sp.]|uniref:hypothetical protein n=1 Tax=Oligoflexus sp. TaxID=1971216 RepID=UPI002D5DCA3B|nr:hypothetical protein [Oligoflexus sp.]HYX36186.1 hypothetical protein [Oligoflexus sp.]